MLKHFRELGLPASGPWVGGHPLPLVSGAAGGLMCFQDQERCPGSNRVGADRDGRETRELEKRKKEMYKERNPAL